jgi:hypothetical protein
VIKTVNSALARKTVLPETKFVTDVVLISIWNQDPMCVVLKFLFITDLDVQKTVLLVTTML